MLSSVVAARVENAAGWVPRFLRSFSGEVKNGALLMWPNWETDVYVDQFLPSRNYVYDAKQCQAYETKDRLFIRCETLEVHRLRHETWATEDVLESPAGTTWVLGAIGFLVEPFNAEPGKERRVYFGAYWEERTGKWVVCNLDQLPKSTGVQYNKPFVDLPWLRLWCAVDCIQYPPIGSGLAWGGVVHTGSSGQGCRLAQLPQGRKHPRDESGPPVGASKQKRARADEKVR